MKIYPMIVIDFSAENAFNSGNQAETDKQEGFDFWVIKTDRNGNIGIMR
ncbi:hypothetical protein [Chryseobacterium sp. SN22]|nr:hypothetical protein [Chryseobacterium sp. SN22]